MNKTKQEHFDLLSELETKRGQGVPTSLAEGANLQNLLRAHDQQVSNFRTLITVLKDSDAQGYRQLISHITLLNTEPGSNREPS